MSQALKPQGRQMGSVRVSCISCLKLITRAIWLNGWTGSFRLVANRLSGPASVIILPFFLVFCLRSVHRQGRTGGPRGPPRKSYYKNE